MHIMKDFTLKRGAIVVLLTIMSVSLVSGQTDRVYVSTSGSGFDEVGDHGSWDNATDELQEAINALFANGGGEIWVESGMYAPTQTYDGSADSKRRSFIMREGVAVIGGFDGTETSLEQRTDFGYNYNSGNPSPQSNATVLSGDLGSESAYHVVYTNRLSNDFVALSDVILTDGVADGSAIDSRGAGLQTRGGGVFNNLMVYGNIANKGGGIYAYRGGIFNNCDLTDNEARDDGNFEPSGTAYGGGIYLHLEGGELNNCFVYDNFTQGSGGGICSTGGTISNSRFVINEANAKGGAVFSYGDADGEVLTSGGIFRNCLMASNTAWVDGGGVFATDTGTWVNCTVVSNRATDGGGGVYSNTGATFTNLISWANFSPNGSDDIVSSPGGVFTHLAIESLNPDMPGLNHVDLNEANMNATGPHFISPTTTSAGRGTNSTDRNTNLNANWQLQITSPLINAGTPDVTLLELGDEDLAGTTRVVQDTVDVGAYELLYYTISANAPENGSVAITDDTNVLPGGNATISLTPDLNFQPISFEVNSYNWFGSLVELEGVWSVAITDIQENYAIEAVFASLNEYTITVSSNAGGDVTPRGASIAYERQDFDVEIEAAYGFKVISILLDDVDVTDDATENPDGSLTYSLANIMADHNISIEFAPYYVVTVNGTVGGAVTPAGYNELSAGESLEVTITPDVDYMVASAMLDAENVLGQLHNKEGATFTYVVEDVNADATLNIEFSLFHIINASVDTGGSISHPGDTKVPVGGDLELIITPDEGFKLTSLIVDGVESVADTTNNLDGTISYLLSDVNADFSVAAAFTEYFVVTVNKTGGGTITPEGNNEVLIGENLEVTIDPGGNTVITAASLNGDNVYGDLPDKDEVSIYTVSNVIEAMVFDVVFTPLYSISTSSSAGGAVTPDGGALVISGQSLDVTITPNPGYKLTSLLVDGVGVLSPDGYNPDGSYTYTFENVSKDFELEAGFSPYYIVTVHDSEGGNVLQSGTNDVIQGYDLEVIITPEPGYQVVSVFLYNIYRTYEEELVSQLVEKGDGSLSCTVPAVTEHMTLGVEFGIAAAVAEVDNSKVIAVIPNPIKDEFKVSGDIKFAQLLNINGSVVAQYDQDALKANINVGHLANGLYILKFEDGRGESGFIKIIIKH